MNEFKLLRVELGDFLANKRIVFIDNEGLLDALDNGSQMNQPRSCVRETKRRCKCKRKRSAPAHGQSHCQIEAQYSADLCTQGV